MTKPFCPRCGFIFTLWESFRHWNPYNTTCPQCDAKLRVKHATAFFGLSALSGLGIAAVAIICEEARIWRTSGSMIFFVFAVAFIVVPLSILLWTRSQYTLNEVVPAKRMKTWILAGAMLIVGAVVGWLTAQVFWIRAFRAAIPSAIQSLEDRSEYSCVVSLAVLNRLEAGETDRAKLLLAREVASYYQHPFRQTDSPRRKKLLPVIESARTKSKVLNEELSKKPE